MVASIVGNVVGVLLGGLISCCVTGCAYAKIKNKQISELDENWRKLQTDIEFLNSVKTSSVDERIKGQKISVLCSNWLVKVNDANKRFDELKTRYEKVSKKIHEGTSSLDGREPPKCKFQKVKRCLYKTRHYLLLSKLRKDMINLPNEINTLIGEVKFDGFFIEKESNIVENLQNDKEPEPIVNQSSRNIYKFPSLKEPVEKLMDLLRDEDVQKIGICGMPGVGKTSVIDIVNEKVSRTGLFRVIRVNVERNNTEMMVRKSIMEQLNLKRYGINPSDAEAEVKKISETLQKMKYLILLDQVTVSIDLEKLGIHKSHELGKVVVATTHKSTLCDDHNMKCDDFVVVNPMPYDDALKLFWETVGSAANKERLNGVAERIVKLCGGLPQLIKALAKKLGDEPTESEWTKTMLDIQLTTMPYSKDFADLFGAFKFVYDKLEGRKKECLLFGALFPVGHEIYVDYLTECWRAEELFPTEDQKKQISDNQILRRARLEGESTIKDLREAFLLERCGDKKCVKVPFLFRGWALDAASPGLCLVQMDNDTRKKPTKKEWKHAKRISLMHSDIQLPNVTKRNKISVLFLQGNKSLNRIPQGFFCLMSKLQVLDLCDTGIDSLPDSLCKLIHLRALYLSNCLGLRDLPTKIKRLKNLEVLDIRHSGISNLPPAIQDLAALRCLRVTFSNPVDNRSNDGVQLKGKIADGVFKSLTSLEELAIDVEVGDQTWNDVVEAVVKEIVSLKVLTTLSFTFPRASDLATFITQSASWNNKKTLWGNNSFRSFKFCVGSHEARHTHGIDMKGSERHLEFYGSNEDLETIREVLKQTCTFELIGHQTVTDLSIVRESMAGLEVCVIENCKEMTCIFNCTSTTVAVLPELRALHLINLSALNCILMGSWGVQSLPKLTTLTICKCQMLLSIHRLDMTRQLNLYLVIDGECARYERLPERESDLDRVNHHSEQLVGKQNSAEEEERQRKGKNVVISHNHVIPTSTQKSAPKQPKLMSDAQKATNPQTKTSTLAKKKEEEGIMKENKKKSEEQERKEREREEMQRKMREEKEERGGETTEIDNEINVIQREDRAGQEEAEKNKVDEEDDRDNSY